MDHGNHLHWEQLASFHGTGADRYYDLDLVVAGGTLMGAEEASALDLATSGRGLAGLDVLHLQCHLGCDAVTMARQGAAHSVGEVVMAALHAGMAVSHLEEHTSMGSDPRGMEGSGLDEDGRYRLRIGQGRQDGEGRHPPFPLPVLYALVATSRAGPDPS
jgi:hypothetical protein